MRKALLHVYLLFIFSFMDGKVKGPRWAASTNGRPDPRRGAGRGPKPKYNEKRFVPKVFLFKIFFIRLISKNIRYNADIYMYLIEALAYWPHM